MTIREYEMLVTRVIDKQHNDLEQEPGWAEYFLEDLIEWPRERLVKLILVKQKYIRENLMEKK